MLQNFIQQHVTNTQFKFHKHKTKPKQKMEIFSESFNIFQDIHFQKKNLITYTRMVDSSI